MMPAILREYFGRNHLGSIVGFSQGMAMLGSITGQPLAGFFSILTIDIKRPGLPLLL